MKWTTPYAQLGASGGLGVFMWEQRHLFLDIVFDPNLRMVLELIERQERPEEGEEPVFELSDNEILVGWSMVCDSFVQSNLM